MYSRRRGSGILRIDGDTDSGLDMDEGETNPGFGQAGSDGIHVWTAWLEPLADELRDAAPRTVERERAVARVAESLRGAFRSAQAVPGATMTASAVPGFAGMAQAALPLLGAWPRMHARLEAVDSALRRLGQATHKASGELEALLDSAGETWGETANAAPSTRIDAWWVAEHWSEAVEAAWEERLATQAHGEALRDLQAAQEEVGAAIRAAVDAFASPLGLPAPGAFAELEAAVDRLDRAHDREVRALREEIGELQREVARFRQDRDHRD